MHFPPYMFKYRRFGSQAMWIKGTHLERTEWKEPFFLPRYEWMSQLWKLWKKAFFSLMCFATFRAQENSSTVLVHLTMFKLCQMKWSEGKKKRWKAGKQNHVCLCLQVYRWVLFVQTHEDRMTHAIFYLHRKNTFATCWIKSW